MPIRDPILDANVGNRIIELMTKRFEDGLELILGNIYQRDGRMAGDEKITDKIDQFVYYANRHDENLSVVFDEQALPGDQERAQQELFEEDRLKDEIFADAELREEIFARAEQQTAG